jgi:hypothetical protein
MRNTLKHVRTLAVMGGAHGNVAALKACLADAGALDADLKAFIGDAIGCCGHSEQIVAMIRTGFDLLGEDSRQWLSTWPDEQIAAIASLQPSKRFRWLRASDGPNGHRHRADWKPEFLNVSAWQKTLRQFRAFELLSDSEVDEALSLLDPAFPFFAALRLADSVHLHVKVHDVNDLPVPAILALGAQPKNARPGYVKYSFPGGINMIFSSIPTSEEDRLPDPVPPKPFVDHLGIDLRRETGVVRAAFEDTVTIARRANWPCKSQGGGLRSGRPLNAPERV